MLALLSILLLAAAPADSTDAQVALVKRTVFEYVAPHDPTPDSRLWRIEWADINGDGLDDALVLSNDADWCGSGGCTLLVVEAIPEEEQEELGPYAVAAEIEMVSAPIRMSQNRTSGWCDLLVQSENGEPVRLKFDGETYPFSPAEGVRENTASGAEASTLLFAAAD